MLIFMTSGDVDPTKQTNFDIIPGITIDTLIADCIHSPHAVSALAGIVWTDRLIDLPGIQKATHITVSQRDGIIIAVDVNQQDVPFAPAQIICTTDPNTEELLVSHNGRAEEVQLEQFGMSQKLEFDTRVAELFRQYFVDTQ